MDFVHQSKQLSLLAIVFGSIICHSDLPASDPTCPRTTVAYALVANEATVAKIYCFILRYWSCGVVRIFSEERDDEEKKVYYWALLQVK